MSLLGFQLPTDTGTLPAKINLGSFMLVFMSSVHPLRPQNVYSLVDTKQRDFSTPKPQLLSCNLIGPYANQLYVLKEIKYFINPNSECAVNDVNDPHLASILKTFSAVLETPVLLLDEDQTLGFSIKGPFDLDSIATS